MKRLEGKTAVVTGAASGIGRATCLLFAKHGANVVAVDQSAAVQETTDAILRTGGRDFGGIVCYRVPRLEARTTSIAKETHLCVPIA